ncbi:NAD(P)H-binding protein [Pediococcus siamensis]|uniref:NAD(P)H-binding protein n=1 Tax=Pediococcus siamensis TaxID=381829 RepID=UPI0039A38584
MKNILILGANGRIAKLVRRRILAETDYHITSFLRNSRRLVTRMPERETVMTGDALNYADLLDAMQNQDIVYANLSGNVAKMATLILAAMKQTHLKRLIWITGSGLYHETPDPFGTWVENVVGHENKENTRKAAKLIENSAVEYTIIRAAFMIDSDEIDYELTQKGQPFKGTMISRESIADLIIKIMNTPSKYKFESLGIAKPGTENGLEEIISKYY